MRSMRVTVNLFVEPDGEGFHVYSPDLPGLHSDGLTEEEAITNAREAVVAYLTSMIAHGEPLPIGCATQAGLMRPNMRPSGRMESVVVAVA